MPSSPTDRAEADGPRGFSLVELLAVIGIVALLATLAAGAFRGARNQASVEQIVVELTAFDQAARLEAERLQSAIVLSFETDRLSVAGLEDSLAPTLTTPRGYQLPEGFALEPLRPDGRAVTIGPGGRSRCYAVRVDGPKADSRWLLVVGLTGEARVVAGEEAEQILAMEERHE